MARTSELHLNDAQRAAVEFDSGPLLVLSGPGTGKTRVITLRIARLIANGMPPERILGLTFTNRAAGEMRTRVGQLVGDEHGLRLGTFHWAAQALLRRYANRMGIDRDFRLLSAGEARHVLAVCLNLPPPQVTRVAHALSALKNGAPLPTVVREYGVEQGALVEYARGYASGLRSASALDLDDLLALSVQLLRTDESVRDRCRRQYEEVLIDEYQDTNRVQQELVRLLAPPHDLLTAVGDEDQAIYGWRYADSGTTSRFLDDFPAATIIRLEESYRCAKRIVRAAGALIEHNPGRLGLSLRTPNDAGAEVVCLAADDEKEEAAWIADEIAREAGQGVPLAHIAVLYRTNAQSRAIEDALIRRGLAYHVHAGRRFYERPEIRRALAWLRLTLGPDDEAAEYLTSTVTGVGSRRLDALRRQAEDRPWDEVWANPEGVPQAAAFQLSRLAQALRELRALRTEPLAVVVERAAWCATDLVAATEDETDSIMENLQELQSIVRDMGRASLHDLIDRLTLSDEPARGGVALMTLHAAKGLEFDVVFLAGLEEGLLPHRRALDRPGGVEEERRLCYVGMTRARRRLALTHAYTRFLGGHALLGERSRFVAEMGRHVTVRLSPRRSAKPRLTSVKLGERVVHVRLGPGTVVAVEGSGRNTLVTVEFDEVGRQRVQLFHAPLTRAGSPDVLAG
ncbi:MAG TPA: UvrD-helicase domain-containing protein [Chloroflexota bacterium]|nr:UvrD-helicase domain-containing protein [Chloroflexota bacterium]